MERLKQLAWAAVFVLAAAEVGAIAVALLGPLLLFVFMALDLASSGALASAGFHSTSAYVAMPGEWIYAFFARQDLLPFPILGAILGALAGGTLFVSCERQRQH